MIHHEKDGCDICKMKRLKSQLAEVTAERDKLKEGLKNNWPEAELLDNAYKEIDLLKTELRYATDHNFMTDRDVWKHKAEKLAEALKELHDQVPACRPECKAREALSEFEEGK